MLRAEALAEFGDPLWKENTTQVLCQARTQLLSTCEYRLQGSPDCNLSAEARAELEGFATEHPKLGTTSVIKKFLASSAKTGDRLTAAKRQALIDALVEPCPQDEELTWDVEC